MFREAVEIIHKMWTEERPTFQGRHYTIDGPINEPKGAQTPHIPFWIAGGGEKVTLKLVAQYGDACNIGREPDGIRHKLEVLKRHCDDLGRDYDSIIKSAEADIVLIDEGTNPDDVRNSGAFPTFGWPTIIGTAAIRSAPTSAAWSTPASTTSSSTSRASPTTASRCTGSRRRSCRSLCRAAAIRRPGPRPRVSPAEPDSLSEAKVGPGTLSACCRQEVSVSYRPEPRQQ